MAGKGRDVGEDLVKSLQNTKYSVDEKLEKTFINFFGKRKLEAEDVDQSLPEDESSQESQSGDDVEDDEIDVKSSDSKMMRKTEKIHGGRMRRKAIFNDEVDESDSMVISLLDLIFHNGSIC